MHLAENINIQWTEVRADLLEGLFRCRALHLGRRAFGASTWCARRAHSRLRALHFRAAWARAWRAFTRRLRALRAVQDDRLLLGNGRLEHILTEVRDRWTFSLQHILTEIRLGWAWRNGRLEDILGHVHILAWGTYNIGDFPTVGA
jgi:hypothetical protein